MNKPPKIELEDDELIEEMEKLEKAVRAATIPAKRQILRGFFTGLASGIGVVIAGAIVIPLLIYLLKDIQWVPLVGGFVDRVDEYMNNRN